MLLSEAERVYEQAMNFFGTFPDQIDIIRTLRRYKMEIECLKSQLDYANKLLKEIHHKTSNEYPL